MPIPQSVKINPLDLQKNIAIGVSLPFDGPAGPFNKTYSTKDQIKSNLINLILTNKGERAFNPEFGTDLKRAIFEGITEDTSVYIRRLITSSTNIFIPEISISEVEVTQNPDNNSLSLTIKYILNISESPDQVTVEFI